MQFHVRIRPWVRWWFYLGVICGVFAVVNVPLHDFTTPQEWLFVALGVAHWLLGGIVCWAFEGIKVERRVAPPVQQPAKAGPIPEWHPASDFLQAGGRHSLLPWKH